MSSVSNVIFYLPPNSHLYISGKSEYDFYNSKIHNKYVPIYTCFNKQIIIYINLFFLFQTKISLICLKILVHIDQVNFPVLVFCLLG